MTWQPIETAPKDGRPILAWVEGYSEACPNCNWESGTMCLYHAHAEGLSAAETGLCLVQWGGGWADGWEDGGGEMPDWWFQYRSEFEVAANPTHWMPLPEAPHD